MDGEFGVRGCKGLHLEWRGSGALLSSTAQGTVCDWVTAVQQKLKKHCKLTIVFKKLKLYNIN